MKTRYCIYSSLIVASIVLLPPVINSCGVLLGACFVMALALAVVQAFLMALSALLDRMIHMLIPVRQRTIPSPLHLPTHPRR